MKTFERSAVLQTVAATRIFCWQHLQMSLPRAWDPRRLTGDYRCGEIQLADAAGATLGIRWRTPAPRNTDPASAPLRSLQQEVGRMAADDAVRNVPSSDEWTGTVLYEEPAPPGRDVWCGFSTVSGRLVELVYFANRRDRVLRDRLLPTLVDLPAGRATPWSVFDLQLIAPADTSLVGYRLNAGDLSLQFMGPGTAWRVRQLAPATLALARRSVHDWVLAPSVGADIGEPRVDRFYRRVAIGPGTAVRLVDRWVDTVRSISEKRRRFFWRRRLTPHRVVLGLHDAVRDRLIILDGSDEPLLCEVASTVGTR